MSERDAGSDDPAESTPTPAGWVVWNDEGGGPATWVYRPDIFDAEAFPAACMPTIHVTDRQGDRRPPGRGGGSWRARLLLEPAIEVDRSGACPTRGRALERASELAQRFVDEAYDIRSAYQESSDREAYIDRLSRALSESDGSGSSP